jgi:hypothetical protein
MNGAILSLPQYAFMAWCSVKAQGQLYLYLPDVANKLLRVPTENKCIECIMGLKPSHLRQLTVCNIIAK